MSDLDYDTRLDWAIDDAIEARHARIRAAEEAREAHLAPIRTEAATVPHDGWRAFALACVE